MSVIINKVILLKTLSRCDGLSNKDGKRPAILITVQNKTMKLMSRDTDQIIVETIPIIIDTENETWHVTVSMGTIHDIIKKLAADKNAKTKDLILERTEHYLSIKLNKTTFNLTIINELEETLPQIDALASITIIPPMIEKVAFATAHEESRLAISGIYLHAKNDIIYTAATDSHRLSMHISHNKIIDIIDKQVLEHGIILSKKTIQKLLKLMIDYESSLIVKITNKYIAVEIGNTLLISRIMDGRFPDYQSITTVNTNNTSFFDIEVSLFMETVDKISILSDEKTKFVRLNIKQNVLYIMAVHHYLGHAEDELPIVASSTDLTWSAYFNAQYILDIGKQCEHEYIRIYVENALTPIKIISIDGYIMQNHIVELDHLSKDRTCFVIMPLKM